MTLFTRKNGVFRELSREDIRKLRRVEDVVALQEAAKASAVALKAITTWLKRLDEQKGVVRAADYVVACRPNQERLTIIADRTMQRVEQLKRV